MCKKINPNAPNNNEEKNENNSPTTPRFSQSSVESNREQFRKSDTDYFLTMFSRNSTFLVEEDNAESVLWKPEDLEDDDPSYEAWKKQLERPHKTLKVRGLQNPHPDLITGHLIPSKRKLIEGEENNDASRLSFGKQAKNFLNRSKDKIINIGKRFQKISIVQPAFCKMKMFLNQNLNVSTTSTYHNYGYDVLYPVMLETQIYSYQSQFAIPQYPPGTYL